MRKIEKDLEKHILLIKNEEFRNNVRAILKLCPNYISEIASSSTGKYHPADEIASDGMLYHIERCVVLAPEIAIMNLHYSDQRDILIAGSILHDLFKNGIPKVVDDKEVYDRFTNKDHEMLIFDLITGYAEAIKDESEEQYKRVMTLGYICGHHSGQWVPVSVAILERTLKYNFKEEDKRLAESMHIIDYVVSIRSFWEAMQDKRK